MSDWSAGYVADVGYTYDVYRELNPLRIKLAFLSAGLAFPEIGTACELGFGQGMSINAHAAASLVRWHGTDFNPAQAGFAQELARASGAGPALTDQSFAEFSQRTDLPDFDFIGLHGIWSWVSDENRAVIVDFIRRKLKVGGVLYISYNTQPGWSPSIPVRNLLSEHSTTMSPPGLSSTAKVGEAMDFVEKLLATNPRYVIENPELRKRFEQMRKHNVSYLAHEYFNRDWAPMSFSQLSEWLEPAKVSFACSANLIDHVDVLNLSPDQKALLANIQNPSFQQTVRDFIVNRQFRTDYFVRGARRLNAQARLDQLMEQRVVLTAPRADIPLKVTCGVGEVQLAPEVYRPVLDFLADHQVRTAAEILAACGSGKILPVHLLQALVLLIGVGKVCPANDADTIEKVRPATRELNAKLRELARVNNDIPYLVSPVTGSAQQLDRFQLMFSAEFPKAGGQAGALAASVTRILLGQDQRMVVEGRQLDSAEEHHAELTRRAEQFIGRVPLYQALGLLDA